MAYEDYGKSRKTTVMRYNDTSWSTVGSAGFSASLAYYTSLAFSPDGTPYVAYRDYGNGYRATVMWYGSAPTATTDAASAITPSSATLNGTVNDGGGNTTVTFDYGTTTSYGTSLAATTGGTISAGSGNTAVSVDLTSLSPVTTYHFRVVATVGSVVVQGSDATFITDKATPTISTLPTASAITYGAALSTSTLTGGTGSVTGTFAWTNGATVPTVGTVSYSVTFTPTDTTHYNTVSNTVSLTVNKGTPTITAWPTAAAITYGAALSTSTLTGGTGSVAGTFAWTNPATVPTAGTASYSVTFMPTDTTDYNTVSNTVSVSINHATTTTSLQSSGNQVMLQSPVTFTATVTTTSGNPSGMVTFLDDSTPLGSVTLGSSVVNLAVSNQAVVSLTVSSLASGNHTISAVYNSDSMYNGSSSGSLSETVTDLSITTRISGGSGDGISNVTILPGDTAKVTLDLSTTSNAATLPVPATLTVSGLPTGATAAVTQSSWSQSSGASWVLPANTMIISPTVVITPAGLSTVAQRSNTSDWPRPVPASGMLSLLLLPFFGRVRKAGKQMRGTVVLLVLLVAGLAASLGLTGCGTSNGFFAQTQKSYDVTMMLTAGSVKRTSHITLTMQ